MAGETPALLYRPTLLYLRSFIKIALLFFPAGFFIDKTTRDRIIC